VQNLNSFILHLSLDILWWILQAENGAGLFRISDLNAAYDPLHFVLMYPRGEAGWCDGISRAVDGIAAAPAGNNPNSRGSRVKVSTREWSAYHMQVRGHDHPCIALVTACVPIGSFD
jgi:hypothetical protein